MVFDTSNKEIYKLYKSAILNEFAPSYLNKLKKSNYLDNIYLLCSYNNVENGKKVIDTIYEVYISMHTNGRSVQRNCGVDQILNYMDTCLECVPIEQLNVPFGQQRHVVFDLLDQTTSSPSDAVSLPCCISAMKETELTTMLNGKFPKVVVCDITVKTVVPVKYPQYSNTDLNNAAIHIPIASTGSSISLEDVTVVCNTDALNNLIKQGFDVEPISVNGVQYSKSYRTEIPFYIKQYDNDREQYFFNYAEFFDALHQMRIINNPINLCYYSIGGGFDEHDVTNARNRDIRKFKNVEEIKLVLDSDEQGLFDIHNSPINYKQTIASNNFKGKRQLRQLNVPVKYTPNYHRQN